MLKKSQTADIKLLIVPDKVKPDLCGGAAIYTDLCFGLAERGFDVTVRCPYPYYPEWTDKSGQNGWRIQRYEENGAKIERFGLFIPRNPKSIVQRLLLDLSFFLSLARSLFQRGRFDAVMVFCPLSGGVAFASVYRRLFGGYLWLNVQDLPADAASAGHITSNKFIAKTFEWIQGVLFNNADVWSSISPVMISRLKEIRTRKQPIVLTPNWIHSSMMDHIRKLPNKVGRAVGEPIRLLYAGNIGCKQGLLDFCKIAHGSAANFQFRIHGDGAEAKGIREWIEATKDPRFSFGELFDEGGFVQAIHDSDLFVITERPGSGASFFPSKVAPCIATGTPILAISDAESPLGKEIREFHFGPWLPWEQAEQFDQILHSVAEGTPDFAMWQRNALDRSRFFDRDVCIDDVAQSLIEIVSEGKLPEQHAGSDVATERQSDLCAAGSTTLTTSGNA
ncbi:MAG: hypothetical protein C0483_10075 [Pirellula sp.]|nr:hypothetical protein [Pirellula sp.]